MKRVDIPSVPSLLSIDTCVVIHHFREAKVADLGHVVFPYEDIPGGEVAVHDGGRGQVVEAAGDTVTPLQQEACE